LALLLEEEERFRKLQASDQANFNERIDSITVSEAFNIYEKIPVDIILIA